MSTEHDKQQKSKQVDETVANKAKAKKKKLLLMKQLLILPQKKNQTIAGKVRSNSK